MRSSAPRVVVPAVLGGLAIGLAFVGSNTFANHAPHPHGVDVVIVGSDDAVGEARTALERTSPGAFDVASLRSTAQARSMVTDGEAAGALDLSGGAPTVLVSGAAGPAMSGLVGQSLSRLAESTAGRPAIVEDAVPLPSGDPRGVSLQQFAFGMTLGAFLFAMLLFELARSAPLAVRLSVPVAFAAVHGLAAAVLSDVVFDALPGSFWALAGLGALLSLAVSAAVSALTRWLGVAGIGVSALLFVVLGNGTSGAATPTELLPDAYRQVGDLLPPGAAVDAVTGALHFSGTGVAEAVAVLVAWAAIGFAAVVAEARRRVPSSAAAATTAPAAVAA